MRTLYWKLSAALLALLLVLATITLWIMVRGTDLYTKEVRQQLNREVAAHIAKSLSPFTEDGVDKKELKGLFMDVMRIHPALEVYLLDRGGEILAFDAPPDRVVRERVDLAPIRRALDGDDGLILGEDPRSFERQKPFSVARVRDGDLERGYLYIILGSEEYDSVAAFVGGSYVLRLSLWLLLGSVLATGVLGLAGLGLLTRPLRRLSAVMEGFSRTGKPVRVEIGSKDEIGELATTYNRMALRIRRQMRSLRRQDELRRELIANISHDLRTPTASIRGHVETLLMREEKISDEQRRQFLEATLRQSEALVRLVNQLFELARLDAGDVAPKRETLFIDELVQDIALKHRPRAQEEGLDLQLDLEGGLPAVEVDVGLIERALDNLIDNAIAYTDAGGVITLALQRDGSAVRMSVRDTGRGIADEDLEQVFERFFRVDKARTGGAGNAGLGLAITKRILDLHKTSIEVESEVDQGTTFAFSLAGAAISP